MGEVPRARASSRTAKGRAASGVRYHDLREPVYLLDPEARAASGAAGGWRILGYLGLTVLWLLLAVIGLAVTLAVLPWRLADAGPLGDAPGVAGGKIVGGVIAVLIVGPVLGAVCGVIVTVTLGLFLSSATFFVRSLRPSYRTERLSFTARSLGTEATGPASSYGFSSAFSLLPVRLTRWSKIVAIFTSQGLVVNVTLWVLGAWWGWFYLFTVCWMLWPARGAAAVAWTGVSIALFAVFVFFVWRNRHQYPDNMPAALRGTAYERSWPNRPKPPRGKAKSARRAEEVR